MPWQKKERLLPSIELSINTWGGPLNILECTPKGVNKAFALDYLLKGNESWQKGFDCLWRWTQWYRNASFCWEGLCHENANPELLPYADEQISLTNDQDGLQKPCKTYSYSPYWQLASWSLCSFHSLINQLIDCSTFCHPKPWKRLSFVIYFTYKYKRARHTRLCWHKINPVPFLLLSVNIKVG